MGICQKKIIQSSKIKEIGPTDLETLVTMIKILQFDKNIQSYLVKDSCDQKEKIMTVVEQISKLFIIQKINDEQLKFILNITIKIYIKQKKYTKIIYVFESNFIFNQTFQFKVYIKLISIQQYFNRTKFQYFRKPQAQSIFEYCFTKDIFDEQLAKQIFKQLIQALKLLNDLKISYSLSSLNQILVTPEGNVLLNGIYIKYKKDTFTLSIFNPPESDELDIEKLNVWKCGILLYILLKGSLPNKFKYLYPYTVKDSKKTILFDPEDPTIPFLQKKLLIEMLNEQPEQRLTYNQILHNQWIIGNSNNVTPRQVINREIIQFDKYNRYEKLLLFIQ